MTRSQAMVVYEALERLLFMGGHSYAGPICPFCKSAWGKYGHESDCKLIESIEIMRSELTETETETKAGFNPGLIYDNH